MKVRRRALVTGLCAAALAVLGAGVAWACTPTAHVDVYPQTGIPGSRVTVTASKFHPDQPIEIRWETAAGERLGTARTASNGGTQAEITVPSVPGDVYYIVAVQFEGTRVIGESVASFEVEAPARPTPSASTPPPPSGSTAPAATAPAPPVADTSPAPSSVVAGTADPSAGTSAATAGTSAATASAPAAVAAPRARPVAARSASVAAPAQGPEAAASSAAVPAEAAAQPSRRSITADLWGGLDDGRVPSGSGLTTPAGGPDHGGLAAGALLSTLAVAVLGSLAGVAVSRRRRAPTTDR